MVVFFIENVLCLAALHLSSFTHSPANSSQEEYSAGPATGNGEEKEEVEATETLGGRFFLEIGENV